MQQLVRALRAGSPEVALLGRVGGEEFAIILPAMSLDTATRAVERLRAAVAAAPVTFGHQTISITVSVGLASQSETDNSIEQITARADDALYHAKGAGRNRVVVYKQPAAA